ncbi:MAG TPA: flagellar basal body rod protein FlgB [Acidobacteriaceae bacterium]|nr:flagellar basal body rod protein FlgB [Terriglobia bacterium]HVC91239.1 flagellar basal body rod protein FlgB [Acidobacteriaceae bacterium]
MEITTPLIDVLGKFLDLTSTQFKLTSSNAANLDTPNYRTMGIDFASEFSAAASQALAARQDGSNGKPAAKLAPDLAGGTPAVQQVDGLLERPDGNNVSMDREGLNLAKEQLDYKTGIELLQEQLSVIRSAIQAQ